MHDEFNQGPDTHEAAMAKADLFKLAQYSFKLFKMIQEGQELEGWVQAKITKSADYIASVYHYMEYEMKISDYGDKLENSDIYSESIRRVFEQKLNEAKKAKEKIAKKDYDGDGKVETEKDEVMGSRMKAAKKASKEKVATESSSFQRGQEADEKTVKDAVAQKRRDKREAEENDWVKSKSSKPENVKEGIFGDDETTLSKKSPQLAQLIALRNSPKYATPEAKASLEARIKQQMDRVSLDKGEVVDPKGQAVKIEAKGKSSAGTWDLSYGPRAGLEGPFTYSNGRTLYYDPKEGAYWDPKTDFYVDADEVNSLSQSGKNGKMRGVTELSKSTLGSYVKKASSSSHPKSNSNLASRAANAMATADDSSAGEADDEKSFRRSASIGKAVNRLTKESAKPSAGMSAKEKSAVVTKAKAGKDIGKPGKGFEKVADKAAKEYGSKEKGQKVAAAAMWKNQAKK